MIKTFRIGLAGLLCAIAAGCTSADRSPDPLLAAPVSIASLGQGAATAGITSSPHATAAPAAVEEDLYYLEFRARSAESYGHTFAMFGRRNAQGQIVTRDVAGLHPASTSDIPYMLGHLVPVPSETGPSDGDLEDQYMTANYRINLSKAEYEDVLGYIRELQESSPVWHAVLYNCSAFVSDIAQYMGLKTPSSLLFPKTYIETLREMNT